MIKYMLFQTSDTAFSADESKACQLFDRCIDGKLLPLNNMAIINKLGVDNIKQLFRIVLSSAPLRSFTMTNLNDVEDRIEELTNIGNDIIHSIAKDMESFDVSDKYFLERFIISLNNFYKGSMLSSIQAHSHMFAFKALGFNIIASEDRLPNCDDMFEEKVNCLTHTVDTMFFGEPEDHIISSFVDVINSFKPIDTEYAVSNHSVNPDAVVRFGYRVDKYTFESPQHVLSSIPNEDVIYSITLLLKTIKHVQTFDKKQHSGSVQNFIDVDLDVSIKPVMGKRVLFTLQDKEGSTIHFNLYPVDDESEDYLTTEEIECLKEPINQIAYSLILPKWKKITKLKSRGLVVEAIKGNQLNDLSATYSNIIKRHLNDEVSVGLLFDIF